MPLQPVFGSEQHQQLVMDVMESPLTCFYPQSNSYSTNFFFANDAEFDYGVMEFDDLDVFTDKVRIACATYLERKNNNTLTNNN